MIWPNAIPAIISALWRPLAWLGGLLTVFAMGRKAAREKAALDAARADLQAHERINHAETGIGASDAERIRRLHEFADRHGG